MPAIFHDPAKASGTKDINLPLLVGVQCPCLTTIEQERNHQQLEDLNLCPSAQVPTMPSTCVERVHNAVGQANPPYDFLPQATIVMHYTTKVYSVFQDLNDFATCMGRLYCFI